MSIIESEARHTLLYQDEVTIAYVKREDLAVPYDNHPDFPRVIFAQMEKHGFVKLWEWADWQMKMSCEAEDYLLDDCTVLEDYERRF